MPLFDYFNMENFYSVIYQLKCARAFEQVRIAGKRGNSGCRMSKAFVDEEASVEDVEEKEGGVVRVSITLC